MRTKQLVGGLIVVALMGGTSSRALAEFFPWWAVDSVIEEVQDRGTLRVGLGLFEPWSACNAEGELIGFSVDVATKVAEGMGVEIEFARTNWPYIIPTLLAEEFDVIISGMQILPERNLKINFTSPYDSTDLYLVAHTGQAAGTADRATLAAFNSANEALPHRAFLFRLSRQIVHPVLRGPLDSAVFRPRNVQDETVEVFLDYCSLPLHSASERNQGHLIYEPQEDNDGWCHLTDLPHG